MEIAIVILLIIALFFVFGRKDPEELPELPSKSEVVSPWGTRHPTRHVVPDPQLVQPALPPQNQEISGPAYVTDGDGLRIKKTEIRLFGIDAPEFAHPYGKKAKWALLALCKGQTVRAEVMGVDSHGRTVAQCFLPDGRDLSAEMVKLGLALDWAKFSGGIYRDLETSDARKKLWLAAARQKGHMHVWEKFEARQRERAAGSAAQ
jgi:micrococcal nuclease